MKNSPLVQIVKTSCCHTEVHVSSAHATPRQCYGMNSCRITFRSHTLLAQVKFLNVSKFSLFPHHNSDFNKVFKYSPSSKTYIVQTAAVSASCTHSEDTTLTTTFSHLRLTSGSFIGLLLLLWLFCSHTFLLNNRSISSVFRICS